MNSNKIIIDITTLVTLVSDVCNDPHIAESHGSVEKWSDVSKNIYYQIIDELKDPVLPKLNKILEKKEMIVVRSAYEKFIELISILGNEQEKELSKKIIERLKIIDDDPSQYFLNIKGH